jgi:hypothetical protein
MGKQGEENKNWKWNTETDIDKKYSKLLIIQANVDAWNKIFCFMHPQTSHFLHNWHLVLRNSL